MSKSWIFSTPRHAGRHCRRIAPGWGAQTRAFSDIQQASGSTRRSSRPACLVDAQKGSLRALHTDVAQMDMEQHLNSLFPPLKFPPELAARILTHTSHPDAIYRHNARLSFIGRRILQTYLHLFLHSSPALHPTHDYSQISQRALNTYVLGEHVAPLWSFGKVMKWTPVAGPLLSTPTARQEGPVAVLSRLGPEASRSVGLYKVQGTAVEALVGGVFHQFGGSVAHRLFHTRVLPNILVPGRPEGLPDVFHEHVMEVCDSMGGLKGDLLAAESAASES